jgi:hypothetical protein
LSRSSFTTAAEIGAVLVLIPDTFPNSVSEVSEVSKVSEGKPRD